MEYSKQISIEYDALIKEHEHKISSLSNKVKDITKSISEDEKVLDEFKYKESWLEKYGNSLWFFQYKIKDLVFNEKLPDIRQKIEYQRKNIENKSIELNYIEKEIKTAKQLVQKLQSEKKELQKKSQLFELITSAKKGDTTAQYQLGLNYFKGDIVEKNISTALEWLQKAVNQGHTQAKQEIIRINKINDLESEISTTRDKIRDIDEIISKIGDRIDAIYGTGKYYSEYRPLSMSVLTQRDREYIQKTYNYEQENKLLREKIKTLKEKLNSL